MRLSRIDDKNAAGKQSLHATIWAKLLAFNRENGLLRPGDRVLAAVSGGPDSVCLAHFLHRLSKRVPMRLHILHLHHGLRGRRADRDARLAERLAARLEIPFTCRGLPVKNFARASRRSLEDAARVLRYRAFGAEARKLGFNKIATAHQMDDQAETLILHLMRGTRAKGLAGIPPKRSLYKGESLQVVRPLLCLTRREVSSYLGYHRLRYAVDETNRSVEFTRNWVRQRVIPLLEKRSPRIREHLSAVAGDLRKILKTSGAPGALSRQVPRERKCSLLAARPYARRGC